jgi:hypothetical protein
MIRILFLVPAGCKQHRMKKSLYANFLLDIALALLIVDETEVSCGVIVGKAANTF